MRLTGHNVHRENKERVQMRILTIVLLVVGASAWGVAGCGPTTNNQPSTSSHRTSGGDHAKAPLSFGTLPKAGMRATCPVMKHAFTIKKGTRFSLHKGRYYVFCCPGCKPKFEANPAAYLQR